MTFKFTHVFSSLSKNDLQPLWPDYGALLRLNKPVGIFLLLSPTLMALWVAARGWPPLSLIALFTAGVVIMRSAGCVINDLCDRELDKKVQRTWQRPLARGTLTPFKAIIIFILLSVAALGLVCCTNLFTICLSIGGFLLACLYPLMKRYTHFPQLVLGAAFGWAVPMAYAAQKQALSWDCWLLYAATVFWVLAYDTLYAMVDREDDKKIGIKSSAIAFGKYDKLAVAISHAMSFILLISIGIYLKLGCFFYMGIMAAISCALYQQWLIRDRLPPRCFQAFLNNQWQGAALFIGTFSSLI